MLGVHVWSWFLVSYWGCIWGGLFYNYWLVCGMCSVFELWNCMWCLGGRFIWVVIGLVLCLVTVYVVVCAVYGMVVLVSLRGYVIVCVDDVFGCVCLCVDRVCCEGW